MAKPFLEQFAVAQRLRGAVFDFLAGHVLGKTRQQLGERGGDFIREFRARRSAVVSGW